MFSVSAQTGGSYVLMVASGPAMVPELCACISFLAELVNRTGQQRALVDILSLAFVLDPVTDRSVFEHLVDSMPALERLAVVVPAGTSHGLIVGAARAKGIEAAEFSGLLEAETWLSA